MPRNKNPRSSFVSLFHVFRRAASTSRDTRTRGRRRPALPLSLELLEDRTLLSAPPVLNVPQTNFDVVKTTTLSVAVSATDQDSGQTLIFSLSGAPAGATITSTQVPTTKGSKATGLLTWTPTPDQGPASYPFTITVTDTSSNPQQSASQQITVNTESVGLVGNNLLIVGTSGNDVVSVNATTAANVITATVNGVTSGPFTVPTGGQILANLYGGDDSFTLNEGTQPVGPSVAVDGGTGTNSLIVNGTSGPDAFAITGSAVSLAGANSIGYSNFQSLAVNGLSGNDTFTMTGINPATATTLDGGNGTNSFTGNFAQGFNGALTLANEQSATMQVTGDFTGSLTVNNPGVLQQLSVTGTVTANSIITATNISNVNLGTLAGQLTANGGSLLGVSITSIASGGLLQAIEVAGVPGSGVISNASIGTNAGTISAGAISGMMVTNNASGSSIKAAGQGTISNISVGNNSGSITAVEDTNPGSGTISNSTIGTNSGSVSGGSISGMSITSNSGSITAAGQGTISNISVGSNSGSITAVEDTNPGSGKISNSTIGTNSGSVSGGSISGMSITSNSGSITAAGQGTISNISVGSNSGSITAVEDTNPGSGTISNSTIGTNSGSVSGGSISGMSITSNSGSITSAGQGTISNISVGSNSGSITAVEDTNPGSGKISNSTIGTNSGSVSGGSISGMSITSNSGSITAAGAGTITNLTVGNDSGLIQAKEDSSNGSGTLSNVTIGTLTTAGIVSAANSSNLSINTVAGSVTITNFNLFAGTVTSTATFQASQFDVFTAQHAAQMINFIEPTVTRTLTVSPHASSSVPDYGFYYDGTGAGNPVVVVQVVAGSTPAGFDLGVTTSTATNGGNGFDLAGLYSVDAKGNHNVLTGIHNLVVGGNLLLGAVPAGAISFFNLPTNTAGGVQLPQDTVAVAVAGNLPAASIVAKAVPALAAGSFAGVSADTATHTDALVPLAAGTGLTQANDTFGVFVSEANHVAQFLVTGPGHSFDAKPLLFADQVADNSPVTATVTLVPTGRSTTVSTIAFTGQGGSLTTAQAITTSITAAAGGSLGDLILSAPQGLTANVTAPTILGSIVVTNGGISGTIETTGDLGRTFTDANGNITGVTSIQAGGGGLTGQIIVGGNLISQVSLKSGLNGVIAVQGDIGAIQTSGGIAPNGALSRFGGITVSTGGVNGQIVALGNVFGDLNISGGLSGRIAVQGNNGEYGLGAGRYGILGNVSIKGGISTIGVIVSAGLLGDATGGTQLSISGNDKGILAAVGDINFGSTGNLNAAGLFENVGSPSSPKYDNGQNAAVIDAIFGTLTIPNDLTQLLDNVLALAVGSDGNLTEA
ncbi:MAG TPA: hypothetical protein VE999_02470 [Gemmataceae bacterium]|nr:hypothetical protein [Gemmataceae bacterium]